MRNFTNVSLPLLVASLTLGACSSNNNSSSSTALTTDAISFIDVEETFTLPIGSVIDGAQMATGIGTDAELVYVLYNNNQVVVFTEQADFVQNIDISMLASVSPQALSVEEQVLGILDSQGQLYINNLEDGGENVISYNYPETPDFAALTYGENGQWITVNRRNAKTQYTLNTNGSFQSMTLDNRLSDYEIVGADIHEGQVFVLSNRYQQARTSSIFQLDAQGLVETAWSFEIDPALEPSGLNVADPESGEFVIVFADSQATIKIFESPDADDEEDPDDDEAGNS